MNTKPNQNTTSDAALPGTEICWPEAACRLQRLLVRLNARHTIGCIKPQRMLALLTKRTAGIKLLSGFHPLNLFWLQPKTTEPQIMQTYNSLWHHEHIYTQNNIHTTNSSVEMYYLSDTSAPVPNTVALNLKDGHDAALHAWQRSSHKEFTVASYKQPKPTLSPAYTSGKVYPPLALHSMNRTAATDPAFIIKDSTHANQRYGFNLATARKPRRETMLGQSRTISNQSSSALVRSQEPLQFAKPISLQPAVTTASPADNSSFVNSLFDRAMQSQALAGLDLRLLPMHAPAAVNTETTHQTTPAFWADNNKSTATILSTPQPLVFSHHDVHRVADKVAHILQQKERLERERWGKY